VATEPMQQISVGNYTINVVRKNIKNLHLGVYPPDGRIRIAAPSRVNDEAVRLMVISKLPWIKKQVAQFENQERQSVREYVSGESHYFQGDRYLLNVIYHHAPPKVVIKNKKYLDLYVREGSERDKRHQVMREWYRQQLKEQIAPALEQWQKVIGVDVEEWSVKQMKTKWGSCNTEVRRVWFNLELAKKSQGCLEYVIVHEMMHLLERHHNERFIAYMDQFLPSWRSRRNELNQLI